MPVYQVFVKEKVIEQDMYYKNQIILRYTIRYPQFICIHYQLFLDKINAYYRTKALMYERSNVSNLFQLAMVEYEYSIMNDFPIRQFEAFVDFEVTYNQNCTISLYFDQYEYAGGAHGLTIRTSDTWSLQKSRRLELSNLYPNKGVRKDAIADIIIGQIDEGYNPEESIYFDDYAKLVTESTKLNQFYLTKAGVVVYFQLYDIAPYSSGIPTFILPYCTDGPVAPRCS